ncbi:MAG: hypothetical protein COB54_08485 [Alphaproteobacteria bacterium]|nr:MAG: hypothetical protein COB54_08485 [Alphaproteobacteria bacterium]
MILEALQHFLTPARREVKALGYVREAIAIDARYNRCRADWADHLDNCRQQILITSARLTPGSTVMIIGSGALHDVPVAGVLDQGHSLILVDIVHLPKVRRRYRTNPRIRFIEQDVTGLVRPLFDRCLSAPDSQSDLPKADLVISLNILSQLPISLISYAKKHKITLRDNFSQTLMASHLKLLASLAPTALIISDLERRYLKGEQVVDTEDALAGCDLGTPVASWDWHIAPRGELDRVLSLIHHVACWQIPVGK